jgi:hypothetical protein
MCVYVKYRLIAEMTRSICCVWMSVCDMKKIPCLSGWMSGIEQVGGASWVDWASR